MRDKFINSSFKAIIVWQVNEKLMVYRETHCVINVLVYVSVAYIMYDSFNM